MYLRSLVAAGIMVGAASASHADGTRISSFERYGIGGYIQVVGIHHGFHIETVAPGSAAADDQFRSHDVIVTVDGEVIRNLDHLRAVLAEAYVDDAEVKFTYLRGASLTHRLVKSRLKPEKPKSVAKKRRQEDGESR